MHYIHKLRQLLNKKTKTHLIYLVLFSIFVSIIETIGISAIMPFINIATNFSAISTNKYYQILFHFFNFSKDINFVLTFGFILIGFYLFRGAVNLAYTYALSYFSQNLAAQLAIKTFNIYLSMPYYSYVDKNSSYLKKTISIEVNNLTTVVTAVLSMTTEIFVIVFLYILMLLASWKITLAFTAIFLLKIIFLSKTVTTKVKSIGVTRNNIGIHSAEILNKTFANFKQIKLQDQNHINDIKNDFKHLRDKLCKVGTTYDTLTVFPRLFLETVGFSMVVGLLVFLLYKQQSDILYILPTLSLFVLSLYRLLPSVNRIILGYNALMYYHKSIDVIYDEIQTAQEYLSNQPIAFNKQITLSNIYFAYQGKSKNVLNNVSLTINRGEKIAFVGESGSGKSTLVDLIIGLYNPYKGNIKIDNVLLNNNNLALWRSQIGYIPQQVYLFDGTVSDNVCFGRKFNKALLKTVLKQANIHDFLKTKKGLNTLVGEGGIQLSGGQKQRVAIARALYGEPKILVLDEATSALDTKTEQKIMQEIYNVSEDKTLIIIAHRISTIEGCDKVYELINGSLKLNSNSL